MRTMTMLLASQDTLCRRHAAAVMDSLSKHPQHQEKVGSESGALAAITIALGCSDSETIKHSVRAVANLARCAPLQPRMGRVTGMIAALTQLLRASDAEVSLIRFLLLVATLSAHQVQRCAAGACANLACYPGNQAPLAHNPGVLQVPLPS